MAHAKFVLARRLKASTTDRTIVTRAKIAKTPTWDGRLPATIVEPAIWHFDPDTRVQKIIRWPTTGAELIAHLRARDSTPPGCFATSSELIATPQARDGMRARRNFFEFWLDPESHQADDSWLRGIDLRFEY